MEPPSSLPPAPKRKQKETEVSHNAEKSNEAPRKRRVSKIVRKTKKKTKKEMNMFEDMNISELNSNLKGYRESIVMQQTKNLSFENEAAISIQRSWRGYWTRKNIFKLLTGDQSLKIGSNNQNVKMNQALSCKHISVGQGILYKFLF